MLAGLGQYILDLAENWAAFMTGGTIAALVLVIERLRRPVAGGGAWMASYAGFPSGRLTSSNVAT
jgi:hypothetical protein